MIDVSIRIPTAVAENSTINMTCLYDLGELPLYTVKWYKGAKEFYRYIPKELPPMKVFPPLGAKVDVSIFEFNTFNPLQILLIKKELDEQCKKIQAHRLFS